MRVLNALGYDVFNSFEVVPEFISDIGTKKGEKVDYAIMREVNGQPEPCLLIECNCQTGIYWANECSAT